MATGKMRVYVTTVSQYAIHSWVYHFEKYGFILKSVWAFKIPKFNCIAFLPVENMIVDIILYKFMRYSLSLMRF